MCTIFDIKKTLLSICVTVNDTPQKCILVHNIPPQAKINSQNDSKNGRKFDFDPELPRFFFRLGPVCTEQDSCDPRRTPAVERTRTDLFSHSLRHRACGPKPILTWVQFPSAWFLKSYWRSFRSALGHQHTYRICFPSPARPN